MLGIGKALRRTREREVAPFRQIPSLGVEAAPEFTPSPDSRILLEQAASALDKMQSQCATLQRELVEARQKWVRAAEDHRLDLYERDQEIARLENAVIRLGELVLEQRGALTQADIDRAAKDEEIAALLRRIASEEEVVTAEPASCDVDASPRSDVDAPTDTAGLGEFIDEVDLDRLNADKDVIRFRRHLELLMAA